MVSDGLEDMFDRMRREVMYIQRLLDRNEMLEEQVAALQSTIQQMRKGLSSPANLTDYYNGLKTAQHHLVEAINELGPDKYGVLGK